MFTVDEYGKVTVSLGGVCALGCKHCYTMTKAFKHQPSLSPQEVVDEIDRLDVDFSTVCISGDTDCFIDPYAGLDLIALITSTYPSKNVMFTTRLIPPPAIIDSLLELGRACRNRNQLLIPGISIVSHQYPNKVERTDRVPSSTDRLNFLKHLAQAGFPCLLALRPTFPFSLVPKEEVRAIIDFVDDSPAAVLGEVFLIDSGEQISKRLDLDILKKRSNHVSRMTFLDQPTLWTKYFLAAEVAYVRRICREHRIPYFLRSMSAVQYIKEFWAIDKRWTKIDLERFEKLEVQNVYP